LNTTTLTITADQRGPIYRQVTQHLSGIGDVNDAFERGDFPYAKQLADEFAEDIALLADLGWEPEDGREAFDLRMPAGELMQVLQRLQGEAQAGLGEPGERRAEQEAAQVRSNYQATVSACEELVGDLYRERG